MYENLWETFCTLACNVTRKEIRKTLWKGFPRIFSFSLPLSQLKRIKLFLQFSRHELATIKRKEDLPRNQGVILNDCSTLCNRKEDLPRYFCDGCHRRCLKHSPANSCYSSPSVLCSFLFGCLLECSSLWSSFLDDSCAVNTAGIVKTPF